MKQFLINDIINEAPINQEVDVHLLVKQISEKI
jgi:hypothetical protein